MRLRWMSAGALSPPRFVVPDTDSTWRLRRIHRGRGGDMHRRARRSSGSRRFAPSVRRLAALVGGVALIALAVGSADAAKPPAGGGNGGGTLAWRSTDGGAHYASLLSPNNLSATEDTGFAPGGGDTDLAVAPVANSTGQYNVYVSSLTLANIDVSTSTDGGATWTLH